MGIRKGKNIHSFLHYLPFLSKWIGVSIFLFSIIFMYYHLSWSKSFPIRTVRIYGIHQVEPNEIKSLLLPLISKGFFGLQFGYVKEKLKQLPWVSDIFIRRNWPDQLEVTVIEKRVAARWNHNHLLSIEGELFTPKNMNMFSMPELIGPIGKQVAMLEYLKQINPLFHPLQIYITHLELTSYATWILILSNGIELRVGQKDILTRISHFVKVYPQIISKYANNVDYVDLRYPNGLAVKWKSDKH